VDDKPKVGETDQLSGVDGSDSQDLEISEGGV
jgi:hypothetical protein